MITAYGREQVAADLAAAKTKLELKRAEMIAAGEYVASLEKAVSCPHNHLDSSCGYLFVTSTCKDCGYTWYD